MKKKRWLSILLSLSLLLTLVPTQALAEEGPEGTESACTQTADCPAQVHEPDCPLWQEDSTNPDETSPEETQPTALEQLLALAETLPDPAEVTADNADEVTSQLQAFTRLYAALTGDEQESDEAYAALARVMALQSALDALSGEDSGQATLAATITGVDYIEAVYDETSGKVTYTPTKTADNVTVNVVDETTTTWNTGWYVVSADVEIADRITVSGDVRLILADGCTLTASKGITVNSGNSLTIYGQTNGTGKLTTGTPDQNYAGIGGYGTNSSNPGTSGPITINGGVVTATGGNLAAGIGGGVYGTGTVTINGGVVTATGGTNGAGIGGGNLRPGYVTITGGVVNATGGSKGAGIGGGYTEKNASPLTTVTISGGTVTAKGGDGGAGIGTGNDGGSGSSITISGSFVTATGGAKYKTYGAGAAIGSGSSTSSTGAEADESNFNNAVVLRQSGASGSTMTGQVYGEPTLDTNATVPSGASLTIPESTSLTVGKGTTLTNSGAICLEDNATFNYNKEDDENPTYGTLTGDGKVINAVHYMNYEGGTFVKRYAYNYTVVTNQTTWGTSGQETWYVVNAAEAENLTIGGRITVSGDVHLILADGKTLTASAGINVPENSSLTIYGQTAGTGKLTATGGTNQAGIGGNSGSSSNTTGNSGSIIINGGTVEATSNSYGAAIGGGNNGTGNVTINGGAVTATSNSYGAGIGGGCYAQGNVTITGGTVTASGGKGGAGIGNGARGTQTAIEPGTISITGGFVTATGGSSYTVGNGSYGAGAAIGSGSRSNTDGTEIDTSTFTNAVVLRKSADTNQVMTGQVYGTSVTLTTDATVPKDATLTIPENTTLTLDQGMTLTNNGTIIWKDKDGAIFNYRTAENDEYGLLTGTGELKTGVSYLAYDETDGEFDTHTVYDYTVVTTQTTWNAGWYVADSAAAENSDRITVSGDVHLILVDGAKLTASKGISVIKNDTSPNSLTIYGQTVGTGALTTGTPDDKYAGIGGYGTSSANPGNSGPITIHGGTVTVTGGSNAAGIGGGYYGTGTVTIYGGTVTAQGGSNAAGIGGGSYGSGTVTIYGGTVKANGGNTAAGIGSGQSGAGTVTITGGTVTAKGGDCGAGIGGGQSGSGTVTITGGTVTATSVREGAGIGGGSKCPGYVTITGGTVNATGGNYGAGIGGGYAERTVTPSTTVTIRGGTVTAQGGKGGAGIGTGNRDTLPQNTLTGTISITGGFVTATGGSSYTVAASYSAGAAIGSGGALNGTTGAEVAESNFTKAVVLRQSGEADSAMTGQVYGEPTLDTDAAVPSGAALMVPENTTLTLAQGMTLTNSGAICMEGGSLQYGDPNYGILTGNGELYYLLTIDGGTATATDGMATYNDKTYAGAGTTVTLTAEAPVGRRFEDSWTASANVEFTKVEGTGGTEESWQFTMPAQPLTVTAEYTNAPTYTVTIPAGVSIGDTATAATVGATGVNVAEGYNLNVTLTATSGTGNAFTLALSGHPDVTLGYTMTLTKTTVKLGEDGTENTTEPNSAITVSENPTVLTIPGGTANSSGTAELTFAMTSGQLKQYSGSYTGTVTFSVSVTQDEAPDGGDNPGDSDTTGGTTTTDTTGGNP